LINSQFAYYLWDNYEGHPKYHLASLGILAMKTKFGGLGIPNLADINLCLLASWVKKYHLDCHKMWKVIIDEKYKNDNQNMFSCPNV
jgi:hypothetical protein